MYNVSVMELETNLTFNAQLDQLPQEKQNFSVVYIDNKEVKRPAATEKYGTLNFSAPEFTPKFENFFNKWFKTKKRIDLMLETQDCMFFLKGCSIKSYDSDNKSFILFYNSFQES